MLTTPELRYERTAAPWLRLLLGILLFFLIGELKTLPKSVATTTQIKP